MTRFKTGILTESGYIQVLTTNAEGTVLGCRFMGTRAGPHLVLAGHDGMAQELFDRLIAIPTLPWMRGCITMVRLDLLGDIEADLAALSPLGALDRTIVLPLSDGVSDELAIRRGYHSVLSTCAGLGMISGRGVRPCR